MAIHGNISFSGINVQESYVRIMAVDCRLGYALNENNEYDKVIRFDYTYAIYADAENARLNPAEPVKTVARNIFSLKNHDGPIDTWSLAYKHLKEQTEFINFLDIL